ncbi:MULTISPECIES: pyruvate kinase [unclassified Paenibacillus]|uniref:pyruvate kinase n=1 Tax=unclassified Paenibacillus TaxID=185978 RepID=UPI00089D2FCE|nr:MULTISPECIES: pyruvate kinase [unclassified Paenibacillus]OMC68822.1 pyruvate kinase [Paenibacillus sp. FSL H7-0326]SDX12195.1 pyruvate kinase [Paenibacillus sp. PDC88]
MLKTKIICTMGPACDSIELLKQMIQQGMTVARLNMAHGEPDEHVQRMKRVRQAAEEMNTFVPIMIDIKGPEIRIGKLKEASVQLMTGEQLILTTEEILGDATRIGVNYAEMNLVVKPGNIVLIDDGLIGLEVMEVTGADIHCKILNGGVLKPRKGVNLPGIKTTLPGVTERDKKHIAFGLENKVEMIAASFVRKGADIEEIRSILKQNKAEHVQIYAKIENQEGVDRINEIIEASDGIMVARGDLGVEVPIEDVPMVQIELIQKCNLAGKPVIVATHMLDSMQVNPRPTRAEVSDVSNAVLQGADVVMLSGESAAGKYPVESVRTMAAVAKKAESLIDYRSEFFKKREQHATKITEVISQSAVSASLELGAKVIITSTGSGFTARMISKYRPKAPILAITSNPEVLPKLCLYSGVFPYLGEKVTTTDEMFESVTRNAAMKGFVEPGDTVVLSAGVPIGRSGTTNLIKIVEV